VNELLDFLRAQLDEDEQIAREGIPFGTGQWQAEDSGLIRDSEGGCVVHDDGEQDRATAEHIARHDPARVLDRIRADRRILDEHASEWRTVEWPHDQNGKGEGLVCRRCQNAEYTEWHPAVGEAGVLPEGFVAPYVLAPCRTVRLLALPHADRPGYRSEWAP
jgi:hypothetical protein